VGRVRNKRLAHGDVSSAPFRPAGKKQKRKIKERKEKGKEERKRQYPFIYI